MVDLHTHILQNMDDGSSSIDESIELLKEEYAMGVDAVCLTPHFYPEIESIESFLKRRNEEYEKLSKYIKHIPNMPKLILGAEVAVHKRMHEIPLEEFRKLCYEGTEYLLIEMPFEPWEEHCERDLAGFIAKTGLTPVIAHIDRYLSIEPMHKILDYCKRMPVQLSAESVIHAGLFSKEMKLLKNGMVHCIISDCHNMEHRKPNLIEAFKVIEKKFGKEKVNELIEFSDRIVNR